MITSLTPNIKYYKNKNIIENSISFEENDNRKLMIGMLFKRSIYKNENLSDYEKFVVSTSFLNVYFLITLMTNPPPEARWIFISEF